jgi:toxin ParE1/3/4
LKRLKIVAPAEAEFREALAWFRDHDPRVAERFAEETRRTLHLISEFPQIGSRVPEVDESEVRRMPVRTFPYHVVFADFGDRIEVLAFAHNRRRPRYFMRRLRRT